MPAMAELAPGTRDPNDLLRLLAETTWSQRHNACKLQHGMYARIAKIIAGFVLLGAGVAMLLLPGPGWLTIIAGLAVLATEFLWAHHLLARVKNAATRIRSYGPGGRSTHATKTTRPNRSRSD